jgi:hypothetical protein
MSKTNYAENAALDYLLRTSTVYLALLGSDPGESGTLTSELSDGGYARQSVTFSAATGGATSNTNLVSFGPFSGPVTFQYWAICDALTVGNALYKGSFASSRTLAAGDTSSVTIGECDISED